DAKQKRAQRIKKRLKLRKTRKVNFETYRKIFFFRVIPCFPWLPVFLPFPLRSLLLGVFAFTGF
ncbi:MAG TPA: hypothetical protein VK972_00570, partial [Wenzhouxiangella sp.]|nr:hypothetical protein [Wenzhouxiangella sp.]